ncbi:MAG: SIMPL domain-containing protein [Bacillota bacterium]|nr:SIMPL domain-containing protein [Bacillota bacterium]
MRSGWRRGILAAALCAALLLGATPGAAEGPEKTELSVTGEGEVALQPDVAYVTLGVETQAKRALEAQQENARLITSVIQRLAALGVPQERVRSSGFHVYPVRVYDKNSGVDRLVGYRVSHRITVTLTELDKVGPVIDGAVAAGANNVDDVRFFVEDLGRVKLEALRRAAGEARAKAEVMAQALGATLGRVVAVSDETAMGPSSFLAREAFSKGDLAGAAAPTPILPGELTVRARVTVRFALS